MKNSTRGKLFAIAAEDYKNDILSLRKEASYRSYSRHVDKLVQHFGHCYVNDITKQDIQKYIVLVSNTSGVETMRHRLGAFKAIMEYADDDWEMPGRLKKPKSPRPKQEFYTFEECRKLFAVTSGYLKVMIMLYAETGLRLGEGLVLTPNDIRDNVISVTKNVYEGIVQNTPKTDSSVRKLCISNTLSEALAGIAEGDGYYFRTPGGKPMWPQQLTYEMRDVCKRAGVPHKGFHAFRRGNITELILNLGIPERIVGMRVGHLSTSITLGIYCKAVEGQDKIWIPKIEQSLYLTNE